MAHRHLTLQTVVTIQVKGGVSCKFDRNVLEVCTTESLSQFKNGVDNRSI